MKLVELDKSLTTWQVDLKNMRNNLFELTELISYKIFSESTGEAKKKSQRKIVEALKTVEELWQNLSHIQHIVDKALEARAALPLFGREQAIDKIAKLLSESSITLSSVEKTLNQREFVSASREDHKISPEKLKAKMIKAFGKAKEVFLKVEKIWKDVCPKLAIYRAKADELKQQADAYGKRFWEFSDLYAKLKSLESQINKNPLGVAPDVDFILAPLLQQARDRLNKLKHQEESEQEQIKLDVAKASKNINALKQLHINCLEVYQHCQAEIENPQGLRVPGSVKDLDEWLQVLKKALTQQRWDAVLSGLHDWFLSYEEILTSTKIAFDANNKLLQKCKELKKRWKAVQCKTKEYEKKGLVVDKALKNFAQKAQQLLKEKISLDKADMIIHSYETRLGEKINSLKT